MWVELSAVVYGELKENRSPQTDKRRISGTKRSTGQTLMLLETLSSNDTNVHGFIL